MNISASKLSRVVSRHTKTRVLVLGDLMVDEFIWGSVSRISPEAPVPVVHVSDETTLLGGAANVVNNIISLGGEAVICGIAGRDRMGEKLLDALDDMNVDTTGVFMHKDQITSIKTRIIAHSQQVVRFDREQVRDLDGRTAAKIVDFVTRTADSVQSVIISDYGKGMITSRLLKKIIPIILRKCRVLAIDPKTNNFPLYSEATVITPNHHEAEQATKIPIKSSSDIVKAGKLLLKRLRCKSVLITWGERGMVLLEQTGAISHIPSTAKEVFDVTGAGDTVISTFALSRGAGADLREASVLSNIAAGIVVGKVGTATAMSSELLSAIRTGPASLRTFTPWDEEGTPIRRKRRPAGK